MINLVQQNYGKQQVSFGTKITFSEDVKKAFPSNQIISEPKGSSISLIDTLLQGMFVVKNKYKYYKGTQILDYIADQYKNDGKNLELNFTRFTNNGLCNDLRVSLKDGRLISKSFQKFCNNPLGIIESVVNKAASLIKK